MKWMLWTTPVAVFISIIVMILIGMTVWEIKSPTIARKGFLPITTTRGDRLFISLLGSGFINLAWLGLTEISAWVGLGIALIYSAIIARWG